ncbi:MAG: response regulator [Deltaproteobacteria bacterium]|nr:response regulator [Deltaproteobacteria bacterium]
MEKIRILIVEDEAISAMSITRALRLYGYTVCERASTGEEAIRIARREKPDVILMDILLAGQMDGFEASREIRSLADIPIVFMTGYMDDDISMRVNAMECVDLLVKPIEPEDIRLAISQALERGRK